MNENEQSPQDLSRDHSWKTPFFTLWIAQACSLLGSQLVQFALIWWLTESTGSAKVLATASLVGMLPQVFLGPLAGAYVDRSSRRRVMVLADFTVALATVVLAVLFATGLVQTWHIYLIMFIRASAGAFHWPAMAASASLMVPKEHLARIQGLNQMLNGGMNILAAPLGAVLLASLPMQGVLAIDVFTAALAIALVLIVAIPQPPAAPASLEASKPSIWADFRSGLRYVRSWPGLMIMLAMATLINLVLNPAFSLMPLLVTKHFNGQVFQVAWMQSGFAVGAIAGGALLSVWGGFRRRILTTMVGLMVMGVSCLAIGLAPAQAFFVALAAVFITGFSGPIIDGPIFAVIQAVVAPEMQGRVLTLITSMAAAMTPLGLIIAGPVSDALGVQAWFVTSGIVTGLVGLSGIFIPAIMRLEEGHPQNQPPQVEESAFAPGPAD